MKIGIVGLGYVGLPLAVAFGKAGHEVVGYDVDAARVERLAGGESDIEDVASGDAAGARRALLGLAPTPAVLGDCDAVLICVPTPLVAEREPDLTYVRASAETVASVLPRGPARRPRVDHLSRDDPGGAPAAARARRPRGRPRASSSPTRRSGSTRGGAAIRSPATPKVVGGITPACLERAERLYAEICDEVVPVSSPEAAELSKLLENTFRSVNIALVNELAQLTDRLGIDIWEVVDAAATKPFGFMRFEPGPGMGGHCLPVDPFYLAFKARQHDFATEFVELAGKINQSQPLFCVSKIQRALNDREKPVKGSRVLIVGVAYKSGRRRPPRVAGAEDHRPPPRARRRGLLPRPARPGAAREGPRVGRPRRGRERRRGRDRHRPRRARLRGARRRGAARRRLPRCHPGARRRQRRPALTCSGAAGASCAPSRTA